MLKAIVISQGNEITSGEIIDENGPWLARELIMRGITVNEIRSVPDDLEKLISVFRESAAEADLLWITGGLGPTDDDFTAEAAAKAFRKPLVQSSEAKTQIKRHYDERKRSWNPAAEKMTFLPDDCVIIPNLTGSAPGFVLKTSTCTARFFPGVPAEMKPMARCQMQEIADSNKMKTHRFYTMGIGESSIAKILYPLVNNGLKIGYRATRRGNEVKLQSPTLKQVDEVRTLLAKHIYSETHGKIAKVIIDALRERKQTLATAESCTGGMVANWLVDIPGASMVLEQGVVVYSNTAKTRLCHVAEDTIAEHGAVSEQVATELAEGIRTVSSTNWGIGITGIAGPGGGTAMKPVGTVHVAISTQDFIVHRRLQLHGTRYQIRESAAAMALFLLLRALKKTKKSC